MQWHGEIYLEDGLHRALRAALQNRHTMHVRVLDLDALGPAGQPAAVRAALTGSAAVRRAASAEQLADHGVGHQPPALGEHHPPAPAAP